jgi:3-oxoacyl-[acyl-carrier protein] reductase
MSFTGRTAVVTGAGRGMGRSHAQAFAARGAEVGVIDIDEALVDETVAAIVEAGGRAHGVACDVADVAAIGVAIAEIEKRAGRIDILVNNAGIDDMRTIEEIDEASFDRMFGVHVKGTFFATRAAVPGMKARGSGKIVVTASTAGMTGLAGDSHYAGAKAALLGLTKAWAKELAPFGIHVNAVAPGATMTEMVLTKLAMREASMARIRQRLDAGAVPLGRYAEPEEITAVVLFLASQEASFITGQVISPNGGEVIVGI